MTPVLWRVWPGMCASHPPPVTPAALATPFLTGTPRAAWGQVSDAASARVPSQSHCRPLGAGQKTPLPPGLQLGCACIERVLTGHLILP